MSTLNPLSYSPTPLEIQSYLSQIGHQLQGADTPLLSKRPLPVELQQLEKLNQTLTAHRQSHVDKCRALYASVATADLQSDAGKQLLANLRRDLSQQLKALDEVSVLDGKGLRTFMANDAGLAALELEAKLNIQDYLLHREEARLVQNVGLGPAFRPGVYALTFSFQTRTLEFAGAFVLTEKNAPVVTLLPPAADLGYVVLFTPGRGFESFSSLADMNTRLREAMAVDTWRKEFMSLLPRACQGLSAMGVWPLALTAISDEPLCEHLYDAVLAKRALDIEWALSLDNNPEHSAQQLLSDLDDAVRAALPDLTPRLEFRAQRVLDRCLEYSAPDWYRNASRQQRDALAEHLGEYDQARQTLINLFGHAASPHTLARYQLLERLADELEINDLDPDRLHVCTRRSVAKVGFYEQKHTLTELALRGLHTGDELDGSTFLLHTTFSYADAPLTDDHEGLTPAAVAAMLDTLKPRVEFETVRREYYAKPEIHAAIEHMLDCRINALAYTAKVQGHITETDYVRCSQLRRGAATRVDACTVALNGTVLKDFWLLRETNAQDRVERMLLCTPQAPLAQQFHRFDTEVSCQAHILGWCADADLRPYLLEQVAINAREGLQHFMVGLGYIPAQKEYLHVTFNPSISHAECLKTLRTRLLEIQTDDYHWSTPGWYRSATEAQRRRLTLLAEEAQGAATTYAQNPLSDVQFAPFERFLHAQAKQQLNALLGRQRQNDVDPDTVWVHYPKNMPALSRPPSVTYTRLFRDGFADSVGFLDAKFETVATFMGPAGVDLSKLTPRNVALSVRGVWIGQRYADEVKAKLQSPTSQGYALRRDATLAIFQLQVHNAALEARLKGDIAQVDLDWFERCIDSLDDSSAPTRQTYKVHRLFIDGDWVIDNYLFSHGAHPVLLYTPNAPDGVFLRQARQFNYLLKTVEGMLDYFTARVGVQSQTRVRLFLGSAKSGLPADLNSTDLSLARYDTTERITPLLDLRHDLYDMKLQRKIDDVAATTKNRTDMIMGLLWTCVESVTAIATAPFPVLSLSLGLLLTLKDGMLALHAYNQGDTDAALQHFIGYLTNSLGAVFTDLRPALKSMVPLLKPLRHFMRPTVQHQAMALIKRLEPRPPAPSGMRPVQFQGRSLWAPKQPDALGRYLLYHQDPVSGELASTARLVNQNADGHWVRSGLTGGAPPKVPATPQALQPYEVPSGLARRYENVLVNDSRANTYLDELLGEGTSDDMFLASMASLNAPYSSASRKLLSDADQFFKKLDAIVPRADVLALETTATHPHIFESAFKESQGLVVGAVPGSHAAKKLLIDNMKTLYDNGVRRLYIEYLPGDIFRAKLIKFNAGGSYKTIKRYLSEVEAALGIPPTSAHSFRALIKAARKQKISVCALDACTGYDLGKAFDLRPGAIVSPQPNAARNFYSHKLIETDVAAKPADGWVALADSRRISTHQGTPGLADLQKTIALRVEDVAPGQPVGIWKDAPGSIAEDPLAKGDFKLTLETAYSAPQVSPRPAVAGASYSEFDIAPAFMDKLKSMRGPRQYDTRYSSPNPQLRPAEDLFKHTRDRLEKAADEFFQAHVPPPAMTLPNLPAHTTPDALIRDIYERTNGLIIGANHSGKASKALLINQMSTLKEQGVKTLYMQNLMTDMHQADLDIFHRSGFMPESLKTYLASLDSLNMRGYQGPYTYSNLVEVAGKHGIRVRALDCFSSYHTGGTSDPGKARVSMFNFFASEVIRKDQAAQGAHKWVAHMGREHAHPYEGVTGIAQTQGAISVRTVDTPTGASTGLRSGRQWEVVTSNKEGIHELRTMRSDFILEVDIPGTSPSTRTFSAVDQEKLSKQGYCMVEQRSANEVNLVHRAHTDEIITTPIQVDEQGRFFVDRWEVMQGQRFISLAQLLAQLEKAANLRLIQ